MEVTVQLPYSTSGLACLRVPRRQLSAVYRMSEVAPAPDLDREIITALNRPIGSPPLAELARGAKKAVLLVDDVTRPTPAARILPVVLEELRRQGLSPGQISIVAALGSHRQMSEAELCRKVGEEVIRRYRVLNSRFDDPAHLKYIGTSEDGVPIRIDEEVAGADLKIGIGGIVPHGAVGWSGGGKIVYPGVAGKDTVMFFHFAHGLTEENMTGREDCPIRLKMESWVQMVGLDFVVNCVLTPDDGVGRVVAGHFRDAQRRGVSHARKVYSRPVREQVDVVVSAAYPHDLDFWQAAKGIYGPEPLLKDGGTLLLVSPCSEGAGNHRDFLQLIGRDDNRQRLLDILAGRSGPPEDPLPLAPAAMMAKMRRRFRCAVVSPGLDRAQLAQAGYEKMDDVESALEALLTRHPEGRVAVVLRSDLTFRG
jgi:nickel-dependent lactate racemase